MTAVPNGDTSGSTHRGRGHGNAGIAGTDDVVELVDHAASGGQVDTVLAQDDPFLPSCVAERHQVRFLGIAPVELAELHNP